MTEEIEVQDIVNNDKECKKNQKIQMLKQLRV